MACVVLNYFNCECSLFYQCRVTVKPEQRGGDQKKTHFVVFCSAEFLSGGETWKAGLSPATLDALFGSYTAFVHIIDCQSLAFTLCFEAAAALCSQNMSTHSV